MTKSTIFLIASLIWACSLVGAYVIANMILDPATDEEFARNSRRADGTIVSIDFENHGVVEYDYVVDGMTYRSSGLLRDGNPDVHHVDIGDRVIVFYDTRMPDSAMLGYPQSEADTKRFVVHLVTIVLSIYLSVLFLAAFTVIRYVLKTAKK